MHSNFSLIYEITLSFRLEVSVFLVSCSMFFVVVDWNRRNSLSYFSVLFYASIFCFYIEWMCWIIKIKGADSNTIIRKQEPIEILHANAFSFGSFVMVFNEWTIKAEYWTICAWFFDENLNNFWDFKHRSLETLCPIEKHRKITVQIKFT